ncbi:hypothetical protein VTP01DRAFT_6640 [Rhizomucor pusillus]|uniref:uncharacterized protein n=1 Tax=Rhizomucor pusillus TaxID=4840 RepID=UPI00374430C9
MLKAEAKPRLDCETMGDDDSKRMIAYLAEYLYERGIVGFQYSTTEVFSSLTLPASKKRNGSLKLSKSTRLTKLDHMIPTDPNARIPAQKLYRLSSHELVELKKQLNELIKKGWIKSSKLPYGASKATCLMSISWKAGSYRWAADNLRTSFEMEEKHLRLPR